MEEAQGSFSVDKKAAFLPAREFRNEVGRTGGLNINLQVVLQARNPPQQSVVIGHEMDIDVDRARTPTHQHRGRATGKKYLHRARRCLRQRIHEAANCYRISYLAHSKARSKLTRRRISALYRECAESGSEMARWA